MNKPVRFWSVIGVAASVGACATTAPVDPSSADSKGLALVGVNVIHVERRGAVEENVNVIIRNGRIASIGHAAVPSSMRSVDLHGKWLIPSYTDGHVHFFQSSTPYTRPDIIDLRASVPYAKDIEAQRARMPEVFQSYLRSGVTSVVDMGGPMWTFDVRDQALKLGNAAPRVYVAGPLLSTNGFPELDLNGDPAMDHVKTANEAVREAEKIAAHRPDVLKFLAQEVEGGDPKIVSAITMGIGEVARAHAIPYAVHATELPLAKDALRAGADILVHSPYEKIDSEFIDLVHKKTVFCTPTLYALPAYGEVIEHKWQPTPEELKLGPSGIVASLLADVPIPAPIRAWSVEIHFSEPPKESVANVSRLRDAGVRIVVGTDAGNIGSIHGPVIFREMSLLARAGMSPLEVLTAATLNPAAMLHHEADFGSVENGKVADLVVLDQNPLDSVANLSAIHLVLKNGEIVVSSSQSIKPVSQLALGSE